MTDLPQIDTERLEELAEEVGREDLPTVVAMFWEEIDDVLNRLEVSEDFKADLHFLKGSALNIGLALASDICRSTEARLMAEPDFVPDHASIRSAFERAKSNLDAAICPQTSIQI